MESTAPSLITILEIPSISNGARQALLGLLSFRNKTSGQCCPRIATLRGRLGGVSYRTVSRWLCELRAAGLLESTRHRGSSCYRFELSKSCGKQGGCEHSDRTEMADPDRTEMGDLDRTKMADPGGVHPYMNQTLLNRQRGTAAAVKVRTVVEKPLVENPAAAALSSLPRNTKPERPAPSAAQLDLNLQPSDPVRERAAALVDDLIREHPEPGRPDAAIVEAQKALAAAPDLQEACASARRNHMLYRAHWATLDPHRFIPQLARWFASGEWKYPPAERKGIQRETTPERRRREMRDYTENLYRSFAESEMWDALRENGQDPEVWRAKVKTA
jgi:hypothetical protein